MVSTFKRAGSKNAVQLEGTKPWTVSGVTLTSTGLRDLDQILSGGQPLGSCMWLEEDRWTRSLADCLMRYWCAEGLTHNQELVIPVQSGDKADKTAFRKTGIAWTEDDNKDRNTPFPVSKPSTQDIYDILANLPLSLHIDKQRKSTQQSNTSDAKGGTAGALDTLAEEEEDKAYDSSAAGDETLTIAWQYKESVQRERLGHSSNSVSEPSSQPKSDGTYCHSYDLQQCLETQMNVREGTSTPVVDECCSSTCLSPRQCCGFSYFSKLRKLLEATGKVQRLLLYHTNPQVLQVALPLLLSHIRTQRLPVVILVVVQPWTTSQSLTLLQRCSDIVLAAESFASRQKYPPPPEFARFQGLLHVKKVSHTRPAADIYGLRRDRRKLHIELLHIPPEDFAASGSSTAGGVRSGAGRNASNASTGLGCASSGGALDF